MFKLNKYMPLDTNKTKKIDAFFFDLDGTLLDTANDLLAALNYILEKHNYKSIALAKLIPFISLGSREILSNILKASISDKQLNLFKKEFIDAYHRLGHQHTKLFPGMDKVLDYLNNNNIKWGIITNKTTVLAEPVVSLLKLKELQCQTLVCADTTKHPKPHPDPMHKACENLNVKPENCMFIGDAITDVKAGKAAGMPTIIAAYGYIPKNEDVSLWGADYIANSVLEILQILKSIQN